MSWVSMAGLCIFVAAWLPMLVVAVVEHTSGEPQTACGAIPCLIVGAPLGMLVWACGLLVRPTQTGRERDRDAQLDDPNARRRAQPDERQK